MHHSMAHPVAVVILEGDVLCTTPKHLEVRTLRLITN